MSRPLGWVAAASLLAAQPAAAGQSRPAPAPTARHRTVPVPAVRHPSYAEVHGKRVIDIPQEAKDAGHNGGVTWIATVAADGSLSALTLKSSSNSPAIDAGAKIWAERARYSAATDPAGTKVTGTVTVHLSYGAWDPDNGGSIAAYRCVDLVRDADWFAAANAGRQQIFWPENAYTSLPGLRLIQRGVIQPLTEREAARASALNAWKRILSRCRKTPDRVFLDLVEDRDAYRQLVESF